MNPIVLIGLGYAAWQIIQAIEAELAAEREALARQQRAHERALRIRANWDAWYATRRIIREYMIRKNEAREQRNYLQKKNPQGRAHEINEMTQYLRLVNQKLSAAYAHRHAIEAVLAHEDPRRWKRRNAQAAERASSRRFWAKVRNHIKRPFRRA